MAALLCACNENGADNKFPEGTIYFTETDEIFPNPERGFHSQIYYTSKDLKNEATAESIEYQRESDYKLTLYLHSYYLTDYMTSDIPQEFLDRLERNMLALRAGGAKVVLRFSYKSSDSQSARPWDTTPEWASRHIDQLTPYLQKYADVIYVLQTGFVGSWGEWFYTDGFPMNPKTEEDWAPRKELVQHLLRALPADRQVALRTPDYAVKCLGITTADTLTLATAYGPSDQARIAGHNDCFVASANDVGTYFNNAERDYWAANTKYTIMGGETCGECFFSTGENAVVQMAKYHWSYINRDYHKGVLNSWISDNHMDEIKRRLGYRLVLDKVYLTQQPQADKMFTAKMQLHNVGFAAPMNKRGVELVFTNASNPSEKYVYPQSPKDVDPRYWFGGDTVVFTLSAKLDAKMSGDYNVYLNLPDPYETLHDNPKFSIRLANDAVWEEETGYNHMAVINVQ